MQATQVIEPSQPKRRRRPSLAFRLAPWMLLGAPFLVFVTMFGIPLLVLLATSFERVDPTTFRVKDAFTFYNYTKFLTDSFYLGVLWTTLKLGALSTLICVVLGYPVALFLTTTARPRERSILMLLIISPLLVSLVIRSLGWIIILGRRGLIDSLANALHLADGSVNLMYTQTAVVIGQAHIFFPFMLISIYASLQNIDPALLRAASNLGATPLSVFRHVTLPLSMPGVVAGSLIVFALCVSSFVTPTLLGGPWVKVVGYLVWEQALQVLDWSFASAIATILLVITGVIMYGYKFASERRSISNVY
jgi:putative spermidine/putrescine transport system permease protein